MLEVCVDTFESAEAAVRGGAHRLELCAALSEGGLTPSVGLLKTIKKHFPRIKVFAMLRPNNKISYRLTDTDMETIIADMYQFHNNNVDGFVFGALTANRKIDEEKCNEIIVNAGGLPVTFHRAFDMTIPAMKFENIDILRSYCFDRILTSGFAETAEQGLETIVELKNYSDDKPIRILPGCGVNVRNARKILEATQCDEFHASCKTNIPDRMTLSTSDTVAIEKCIQNNSFMMTDKDTVGRLVAIGREFIKKHLI